MNRTTLTNGTNSSTTNGINNNKTIKKIKINALSPDIASLGEALDTNDPDCLRNVGNIHNPYTFEVISEIADFLLARVSHRPVIGIICGSGLGGLAELVEESHSFPYSEIPHFPVSTVPGHVGRLLFGKIAGVPLVCMQGRLHHYEGYPLWKCSMPVRVMKMLGCTHLIVSNAAGGLNPEYKVGDIMLIKDHINIMGFAGNGPLQGQNDERFGTRFPPMSEPYDTSLIRAAKVIAREIGEHDIKEGVYIAVGGPNYETVAELRLLKMLGIDAVGMSTIHEVIVARHSNLRVFAFSLITNLCITEYDTEQETNHQEVIDIGRERGPIIQKLVEGIVAHIGEQLQLPDSDAESSSSGSSVTH